MRPKCKVFLRFRDIVIIQLLIQAFVCSCSLNGVKTAGARLSEMIGS